MSPVYAGFTKGCEEGYVHISIFIREKRGTPVSFAPEITYACAYP